MIEKGMRSQLVKLLAPIGAFAVENGGSHPGTPDIATTRGWIECKATNYWPAKDDTPVTLDHPLSQEQRIWLIRWARVNGKAWVMLNVAGEWLLFSGTDALKLGQLTRSELYSLALHVWDRIPTTKELLLHLA